jgi:putative inorganic carbon (hco3(-)) transporter
MTLIIIMNPTKQGHYHPAQALLFLIVTSMAIVLLATPYYPLAVLPGLALIAIMLLGSYPHLGYYLIVFLIPFGAYRHKADWLLAFCLVVIVLFQFATGHRGSEILRSKLWPLLLAFFSVSSISSCLSAYPSEAIKNMLFLTVCYILFSLGLLFISINSIRRNLPLLIVWSVSICALSAVYGYFFSVEYFAENVATGGFKRGIGTSLDPNGLALLILFAIPLLAHLILYERRIIMRFLMAALLVINLLAMVTTFSRSGLIVLCLIFCGLLVEHANKLRPKFLGLLISGAFLALTFLFILIPASYFERQKSLTDGGDKAMGRRSSYLLVGWDAFKKDPLLGSGPGSFPDIFSSSKYAIKFEKKGKSNRRHAHNTYLEVVVGTGILGLIIFLFIMWRALHDFSAAKKKFRIMGEREMTSLLGAYRLSFISLSIFMLTISDLYHKYLFMCLAVSQIALRCAHEKTRDTDNGIIKPDQY